ncbi:MAG: NifU family protein, partial [Candidatus Electrothrix sp. AUS3]|nr:NifU family protein [Candidatus Electrothrix gigas]
IELVDVDGDFVTVALRGACAGCHSARTTLRPCILRPIKGSWRPTSS